MSSVHKEGLFPTCVESQQTFLNQAVREASGNSLKPTGKTKHCHLFDSLPDGRVEAKNESVGRKRFKKFFGNGIHRPSGTKRKGSSKLHLTQRPKFTSQPNSKYTCYRVANGTYYRSFKILNKVDFRICSKVKQKHEPVYGGKVRIV